MARSLFPILSSPFHSGPRPYSDLKKRQRKTMAMSLSHPPPQCVSVLHRLSFFCVVTNSFPFVVLQCYLSAFTSHRAPLPIKTMVGRVFFSLFFFLRFRVLCAPFECPRPQMRPSHATTPGCPEAEATVLTCFDECRCLHFLSGEPIRSFFSSVEKLTFPPFCVFVPAPTRPTCRDPCGSPSLTPSCRRHPPPAQSRNDANRVTRLLTHPAPLAIPI